MVPQSSQSQESDFLKIRVSPTRHAHCQRLSRARPGQRGLAKPGQGREGQKGQTGEPGALMLSDFWRQEGFTPPLRMGPRGPRTDHPELVKATLWRPRAIQGAIQKSINFLIDFLTHFGTMLAPKMGPTTIQNQANISSKTNLTKKSRISEK